MLYSVLQLGERRLYVFACAGTTKTRKHSQGGPHQGGGGDITTALTPRYFDS